MVGLCGTLMRNEECIQNFARRIWRYENTRRFEDNITMDVKEIGFEIMAKW